MNVFDADILLGYLAQYMHKRQHILSMHEAAISRADEIYKVYTDCHNQYPSSDFPYLTGVLIDLNLACATMITPITTTRDVYVAGFSPEQTYCPTIIDWDGNPIISDDDLLSIWNGTTTDPTLCSFSAGLKDISHDVKWSSLIVGLEDVRVKRIVHRRRIGAFTRSVSIAPPTERKMSLLTMYTVEEAKAAIIEYLTLDGALRSSGLATYLRLHPVLASYGKLQNSKADVPVLPTFANLVAALKIGNGIPPRIKNQAGATFNYRSFCKQPRHPLLLYKSIMEEVGIATESIEAICHVLSIPRPNHEAKRCLAGVISTFSTSDAAKLYCYVYFIISRVQLAIWKKPVSEFGSFIVVCEMCSSIISATNKSKGSIVVGYKTPRCGKCDSDVTVIDGKDHRLVIPNPSGIPTLITTCQMCLSAISYDKIIGETELCETCYKRSMALIIPTTCFCGLTFSKKRPYAGRFLALGDDKKVKEYATCKQHLWAISHLPRNPISIEYMRKLLGVNKQP